MSDPTAVPHIPSSVRARAPGGLPQQIKQHNKQKQQPGVRPLYQKTNALRSPPKKPSSRKTLVLQKSKAGDLVLAKRRGKGGKKGPSGRRSRVPRLMSTMTPPSEKKWVEYVSVLNFSPTTNKQFAYPIYSNGAFAVDPAAPAGWTTTPSFSAGALKYAAYRVIRYEGEIHFENVTTSTPIDTIVCHTNSALGASSGGTAGINVLAFSANRPTVNTVKPMYASGGGNAFATHRFSHTIAAIAGEPINQPGYKSLTNTVPSTLTYIVMGLQSMSNNITTVLVTVKLRMLVEFLDYIDTLTSFATEKERIENKGTLRDPQICAGCAATKLLEQLPCPDPECKELDECTNCFYTRQCSFYCPSPRCHFKADTIPVMPPRRTNSVKSIPRPTTANY